MAKIFIVDDDKEFLESFKEIPLKNADCFFFDKPMEAIKRLAENLPDIIVSDIQMPDIHGLNFGFIASQIIKPKCFILISANSKHVVEEKYATIEGGVFFKKPLENEFFDFLIEKINEVDLASSSVVSLPGDTTIKYKNYEALVLLWKEYNEIYFESVVNHFFLHTPRDTDADKLENIGQQINGCKKLLGFDERAWQHFQSEFAINNETWYGKILNNISAIAKFKTLTLTFPCFIQHEHLGGDELIKVEKLELISLKNGAHLLVNDKPWEVSIKSESTPEEKAKALLKTLGISELFFNLVNAEINKPYEKFWTYDLSTPVSASRQSIKFEFLRDPPIIEGNPITQVHIANLGNYAERKVEVIFGDGKKNVQNANFKMKQIPLSSVLTGVHSVTLKNKSDFDIEVTFKDKIIEIPYEKMIATDTSIGSRENDSRYRQASMAISYAWKIALGEQLPE